MQLPEGGAGLFSRRLSSDWFSAGTCPVATQVPDTCFYITDTSRASTVSPFLLVISVLICTCHVPVTVLGTGWQVRSLLKFWAGRSVGGGGQGMVWETEDLQPTDTGAGEERVV